MSSSTDWMPNGGAPLLPKVSPYCVPARQMELKRRPTVYDIRGSGWQMRHYKAPIDAEVPWERVHFWPRKDVHVLTEQEVIQPPMPKMTRTRTRTVAQKGPKVVKAPSTPARAKKVAPKFALRYDYWRVFSYFNKLVFGAQVGKGAVEAAPADAPDVVPATDTTAPVTDLPTQPGAIAEADAAADVDAQTESAADDEAQPSLLAAIFKFGVDFVLGQRKRAHEDDDADEVASGDAKRRRVGSDAQAPSCAEARPAANNTTTGTTVPKYHYLTAVAAQRRDRRKPKPSRALCPPPTDDSAAGEGNANVVKARPIAGRPTRRRADTPDPRVGTPPPSEREATPTSSPSSSRASTPEREREPSPSPSPSPSPAPKSSKSKSKSKSSKSSSKSTRSKSSSDTESSSSKSKTSSGKSNSSSSGSKSSSSGSKSSSASKPSSSKTQPSSSKTQSSSRRSSTEHTTDASTRPRPRSGTEIMLFPHFIYWNRDDKLANPWDPRCAAAPDPRFPWAPSSAYWANARTAPIAPLPDQSPEPPSFRLERAPANPLYTSSTAVSAWAAASGSAAASGPRRDRSPSPAREREREELSGAETEVESAGEETDCEE